MMRIWTRLLFAAPLGLTAIATPTPVAAQAPAGHPQLVSLFTDWRSFNHPQIVRGVPDYSAAAMAAKSARLPEFRARLAAIDRTSWSASQLDDCRYVEAEMNGLDFFLRVLKPCARAPGFYQNVFAEMSDVPAHEGPSAEPNIDLYNFTYPLSAEGDAKLTELLGAVPGLLADAKANLAPSQAHDLWAYGDRAFAEQADVLAKLEAGTLILNDLGGKRPASLEGATPQLRTALHNARVANEQFAQWVRAEAPRRTGPSGVGKANYDWYLKHVLL